MVIRALQDGRLLFSAEQKKVFTKDKDEKLFSRDIVAIDMRLPDRLTVKLSEEAAKAREELFKDKKPKKKAGDA